MRLTAVSMCSEDSQKITKFVAYCRIIFTENRDLMIYIHFMVVPLLLITSLHAVPYSCGEKLTSIDDKVF